MPKNKGFTLIELTGVMVVISLILLFTLPQIIQNMKDAKNREYDRFVEDLKMAAETYIESNRDNYPELTLTGGRIFVSINDLMAANLVKKEIVDPRNNTAIDLTNTISVTKNSNGTIEYEYGGYNGKLDGYNSSNLLSMYDGITSPINSIWSDVSPNSYDATMTGFNNTATSGWQNNYLAFDGIDDKVVAATTVTNDFTVEFSYHKDADLDNLVNYTSLYIVNTNDWSTTGTIPSFQLFLDKRNDRALALRFLVPPVGETPYAEQRIDINEDNYNTSNLTITFTKTATEIVVYANGQTINSITEAAFVSRFNVTTLDIMLGSWNNDSAILKANNFRIYNRALTNTEVLANYNVDTARYGE